MPRFPGKRAFSLPEAIVVVALLAVLFALALPAMQRVRIQAEVAGRTNSLREIGNLILSHASDHRGVLPGPLWPGQIGYYDPEREGRLAGIFAERLNQTEPGPVALFLPRGLVRALPEGIPFSDFRPYVMNMDVDGKDPWDSLAEEEETGSLATLASISSPSRNWAISEADQQHPSVAGASWRQYTILEPAHGTARLAWYFDGRVDVLSFPTDPE